MLKNFISISNKSGQIEKDVQNGFKISRLILDFLTPVLREWLVSYINQNQLATSISEFFDELINGIDYLIKQENQFKLENKFQNSIKIIKKTLDDVKKCNNNKYPNDFSHFDITFCAKFIRNIFDIKPENGYINDYSIMGNHLINFNEADAFNYSRIIRNEFYGHKNEFKIEAIFFNDLIEKLDKIFKKLNINNHLIKLKEEILEKDIRIENTADYFEKWQKEKTKLTKELKQVNFSTVEQIFPFEENKQVKLTAKTKCIQLTSFYIQQYLDENNQSYLSFKIDFFIKSIQKIEAFLKSKNGKDYSTILIECFPNKQDNSKLAELISNLPQDSILQQKSIIVIGIDSIPSFEPIKLNSFNLNNFDFQTKMNLIEKPIKFEGRNISFKDLIGIKEEHFNNQSENINEIFQSIEGEILENLITNQSVEIFKQNNNNFNEIKNQIKSNCFF